MGLLVRDKVTEALNVFSEIMTVYDLDNPAHAKPHPYLILEIMKRLKVRQSEAIMVGDAPGDVQMAKDAGVIPVAGGAGYIGNNGFFFFS